MSVRLRLTRVGGRKDPIWRVVVADQRSPRDGRVIETIGRYNAQTNPSTIAIDAARARDWLARGAQPSATVRKLLLTQGILAGGATSGDAGTGDAAAVGSGADGTGGAETGEAETGDAETGDADLASAAAAGEAG